MPDSSEPRLLSRCGGTSPYIHRRLWFVTKMIGISNATYPPLNKLKRIAENLRVVGSSIIRFGMSWPKMPFPTGTTVVRLAGSCLLIHSPTHLTLTLRAEIECIGHLGRTVVLPRTFVVRATCVRNVPILNACTRQRAHPCFIAPEFSG